MSHAFDISVQHDHERGGDPGDRRRRSARAWGADDHQDVRGAGRRFSRGTRGTRSAEDWLADNRAPAARAVWRGATSETATPGTGLPDGATRGVDATPRDAAPGSRAARDAETARRADAAPAGHHRPVGDDRRRPADDRRGSADDRRGSSDNWHGSGDDRRRSTDDRRGSADNRRRSADDRVVEDWLAAGGHPVESRATAHRGVAGRAGAEDRQRAGTADRPVEDWLAAGGALVPERRPAGGHRAAATTSDWVADAEHRRVENWLAGGRSAQFAAVADELDPEQLPVPEAPTLELELPLGETRPARRTVTVTGHPDAVRRAQRAGEIARRRPAPSLDARLAHRPDRIAMWACAMGLLLVIIAIATTYA